MDGNYIPRQGNLQKLEKFIHIKQVNKNKHNNTYVDVPRQGNLQKLEK